jgi:hypothetical protein
MSDVVPGEPAAAVDQDRHRVRSLPIGKPELSELKRVVAVRNAVVRLRRVEALQIGSRQQRRRSDLERIRDIVPR